jgi:hypothetical protein
MVCAARSGRVRGPERDGVPGRDCRTGELGRVFQIYRWDSVLTFALQCPGLGA